VLEGLALDATGVGAAAGVPVGVVSTAAVAQGGAGALTGAVHLLKAAAGSRPGKDFTKACKGEIDERDQGKCQNCGKQTEPIQNKKGAPHPTISGSVAM
jgi:hypothetical protein